MSDDDFMQDSDEEYDFEYEDDDEADDENSKDVDIENKYYNAKQLKTTNPDEAIEEFLAIPDLEEDRGEWGFKGLKQAIKLAFKARQYERVTELYGRLLTYVKSAVTRNYSEKSIDNLLNLMEKDSATPDAARCTETCYSLTLECFQTTSNERLWLKTSIKLARLMLERRDYAALARKLRELHQACQREDGSDDPSKGTYSLEIYALEIQMYAETKQNKQLKYLYHRALKVHSAVPHPKIQGIIRECGGKMHMSEENWKDAQSDFFESFRNYDEAGDLRRIQVLKYLLLTTMLMESAINPFDSQETKPYRHDPRVAAMTELVEAYQHDDMDAYARVLARNQDLLADPFIAENIDEVTRTMRTKAITRLIAPYRRMRLSWIARRLQLDMGELQEIISFLITERRIHGHMDETADMLVITAEVDAPRIDALHTLTDSVRDLYEAVFRSCDGLRSGVIDTDRPPLELPVPPALAAWMGRSTWRRQPSGRGRRGGRAAGCVGGSH